MAVSLLDSLWTKNRSELNSSKRDNSMYLSATAFVVTVNALSLHVSYRLLAPFFSSFHRFWRLVTDDPRRRSLVDLASNLVSFLNSRWFHFNHTMSIWTAIWHKDIMLHWPRLRVTRAEWLAHNLTYIIYSCCNLHSWMKLARSGTTINKTMFMIVSWYYVKDFSFNES